MARRPRLDLPGIPQHVIQRGNNRCACFFEQSDYQKYMQFLALARRKAECKIHSYVLMTNHVHLLVTGKYEGSVSVMMQSLGRCYVKYFNEQHQRTGTLWEGRFRSTLVDSDNYLLSCYRYIELNPVRAKLVTDPAEYLWSSYKHHLCERHDPLIEDHEVFQLLGASLRDRANRYRELCSQLIDPVELGEIRNCTNRGYTLGNSGFSRQIESVLERRTSPGKPGRPKLQNSTPGY